MTDGKRRRSSRRGRWTPRKATEEPVRHMISQKSYGDNQDYPFAPSRYQTRRSSSVLDPVMPSSLRPAMRILNEKQPGDEPLPRANTDIEMPELHHCTTSSQPTAAEDIVCKNTAEKGVGDTSVSTRSPTWSASARMHLVPLHCREKNYVDKPENSTTTTNYVDKYCQGLSESRSLNITEYAKRLQDDLDDDPEEIESTLDPAFDCVNGHKVKMEIAPLLRAIFEKYGDITEGSPLKSSNILSLFLERICVIYQRLEQMKFFEITCIQLNDLLDEARDFEHQKINVRWLRERIEFISETKIRLQGYHSVKQEVEKSDASIGSLEQEVADLRQKLGAKEAELVQEKAKANEIQTVASNIRDRVNTLRKQGLVHGLL